MIRQFVTGAAALGLLAACATPTPPSITTADIQAAEDEFDRVSTLPLLAPVDRPVGTVAYTGKMGGDLTIDGEGGYSMLADMTMQVNYGLSGSVGGTVGNINLIEDGIPNQRLGGSLDIAGSSTGTTFSSTAEGKITAVPDDVPFRGASEVRFSMTGNMRQDGPDTALVGSWAGGSVEPATDDFDVSGSGNFFATAD